MESFGSLVQGGGGGRRGRPRARPAILKAEKALGTTLGSCKWIAANYSQTYIKQPSVNRSPSIKRSINKFPENRSPYSL